MDGVVAELSGAGVVTEVVPLGAASVALVVVSAGVVSVEDGCEEEEGSLAPATAGVSARTTSAVGTARSGRNTRRRRSGATPALRRFGWATGGPGWIREWRVIVCRISSRAGS